MLFEDDSDAVKEAVGTRLYILQSACAVIYHAEDLRILPVEIAVDLPYAVRIRHDASVVIEGTPFVQESDLYDVCPRINYTLEYRDHIVMAELPVVYISAVS